jgi:hypothetical protein
MLAVMAVVVRRRRCIWCWRGAVSTKRLLTREDSRGTRMSRGGGYTTNAVVAGACFVEP